MMRHKSHGVGLAVVALLGVALSGCQVGTKIVEQTGPRGAGMDQVKAKSDIKAAAEIPAPPYPLTADMRGGPRASATYQNVKVLGDLSSEEFNHLMASITTWVAPDTLPNGAGGCTYCHNPANMASDEKYTKVVARRMLQMTLAINGQWQSHVKATGVTCWTCHRGNPVPVNHWSLAPQVAGTIWGNKHGQNTPSMSVGYASLPYDPFATYILGKDNIRVVATDSVRRGPTQPGGIKQAEVTYGLMMHLSQALGVNCTFCHNAQSFQNWGEARPQRVTAWYGLRMVRDINATYISSLTGKFPAAHAGPLGDPLKANCATCHQGLNKPLGGVSMLKDYPYLAAKPAPVAEVKVAAAPPALSAPATTMPAVMTPPAAPEPAGGKPAAK